MEHTQAEALVLMQNWTQGESLRKHCQGQQSLTMPRGRTRRAQGSTFCRTHPSGPAHRAGGGIHARQSGALSAGGRLRGAEAAGRGDVGSVGYPAAFPGGRDLRGRKTRQAPRRTHTWRRRGSWASIRRAAWYSRTRRWASNRPRRPGCKACPGAERPGGRASSRFSATKTPYSAKSRRATGNSQAKLGVFQRSSGVEKAHGTTFVAEPKLFAAPASK